MTFSELTDVDRSQLQGQPSQNQELSSSSLGDFLGQFQDSCKKASPADPVRLPQASQQPPVVSLFTSLHFPAGWNCQSSCLQWLAHVISLVHASQDWKSLSSLQIIQLMLEQDSMLPSACRHLPSLSSEEIHSKGCVVGKEPNGIATWLAKKNDFLDFGHQARRVHVTWN